MDTSGLTSVILIIANVIFSYKGLSDSRFFNRYSFVVDKVLINKDYKRLVTSGFLHVSWMHLIFNMFSLYIFSDNLQNYVGNFNYVIIYAASLIGGNLFALFIHKDHGNYSAVGASGAVCGIIYSSIALFPGFKIGFFGIPFSIPGWLYGVGFVLYSIYGIRSKKDNIGHEAHLGGSIVGLLVAIMMQPSALKYNYLPILLIIVPSLVFIYFIIKRPGFLLIDNQYFKKHNYTLEDRYNASKLSVQEEIDMILEKIHKKGVNSLTQKEKEKLRSFSKSK
jgi:membrane associated rhomboid family serine protease